MNKKKQLNKLSTDLKSVSDSPEYELELILMHLLDLGRSKLLANYDELVTTEVVEKASVLVDQRLNHIPLQYLLGHKWFMGNRFEVNEHTFIPRDDTEILVEKSIEWLVEQGDRKIKVIELGTGSGAIITSIVDGLIHKLGKDRIFRDFEFIATDIIPETLQQAKKNFGKIHAESLDNLQIRFIESDIFDQIEEKEKFDLIISNPPYIPEIDKATWQKELNYEPQIALTSGEDGMGFYNRLIPLLPGRLAAGGVFMGEIHPENKGKLSELAESIGFSAEFIKGLGGEPRFIEIHS
jgi:release factor glutamine methyltransferase